MTPTVTPAMRSTWRYSRHLYVRIHRTQGRKTSIHSTHVIRFTFDLHRSHSEPPAAAAAAADDDEDDGAAVGCCRGMTLTGRE